MEAGRELDVLVAEKVLGHAIALRWCSRDPDCGGWDECESFRDETDDYTDSTWYSQQSCYQSYPHNDPDWRVVPSYSTDIGAAWQVVDYLRTKGIGIELTIYPDGVCMYWLLRRTEGDRFEHFEDGQFDTAMLAICHAALDAG